MMARGHSIEYFIEGGRSRTGRLMQPKTGMLAMTVRAYVRKPVRPVVFVPIYFGYERLVEGRTYIGELSGRPKEKESILGMLRTPSPHDLLERHVPGWDRQQPVTEEKPAWLSPLCVDLAHQIMARINAAACVTPVNLMGTVLLATPRQRMGEADLARQLELYASLMRQAPYSRRVWVTPLDGQSMIRHCDSLRMLYRQSHPLGDIVGMSESTAVLSSYYRNNVLHLLLMPSLLASAFLNNTSDRSEWRRPAAESSEAVQLSVLARISVPILERYYLAISLLLRAGSGRLTQDALERQCQLTAQRMAMLYELNSPEFFDRALFGNFVGRLRARNVVSEAAEDKLVFDAKVLEAVASDAQFVLHEQIRNSILQVVHR